MADWFVTDNPIGGKHIIVATVNLGDPSRSVVAALPPHNPDSPANAHLIAAAPDLLAACEAIADLLDGLGGASKPKALVLAAIAKAKGEPDA